MFEIFNIIFTNPITNVMVGIYKLLASVGAPYPFGLSIILLTVFIRLILYPLTTAQIRSAHKMQKVAPHITAVRERHKGDNKRQQEEIMRLYKEHGVNPAAGCLPLIIQMPIIFALYSVLTTAVNLKSAAELGKINGVLYFDFLRLDRIWNTDFLGVALGSSPSSLFNVIPFIVLVPVLTGAFQFVLSKMMMPEQALAAQAALAKKTETKSDDFQAAFQKQSMYLFPAMIGFFSFTLPLGLSLYWNTFTLFGILQQYLILGPGAAGPLFNKIRFYGKSR